MATYPDCPCELAFDDAAGRVVVNRPCKAHKDIHLSVSLDAETAEQIDLLKNLQGVSHAEIVRRATHLLAAKVGVR